MRNTYWTLSGYIGGNLVRALLVDLGLFSNVLLAGVASGAFVLLVCTALRDIDAKLSSTSPSRPEELGQRSARFLLKILAACYLLVALVGVAIVIISPYVSWGDAKSLLLTMPGPLLADYTWARAIVALFVAERLGRFGSRTVWALLGVLWFVNGTGELFGAVVEEAFTAICIVWVALAILFELVLRRAGYEAQAESA